MFFLSIGGKNDFFFLMSKSFSLLCDSFDFLYYHTTFLKEWQRGGDRKRSFLVYLQEVGERVEQLGLEPTLW